MMENIHSETYSLLLDTYIKASRTPHPGSAGVIGFLLWPACLTLASLVDWLLPVSQDPSEKAKMFNAIETIPCIKQKANWAFKVSARTRRAAACWMEQHIASHGPLLTVLSLSLCH